MKKLLSLALALLLVLSCVPMKIQAADGIAVNETNFPDDNFRAWILAQDYGEDGVLTAEELAAVTYIGVYGRKIKDLTGIEYFTALERLGCYENQLTSLDVSKNTKLEVLYCYNNQLTSLDVSKNTKLEVLYCYNNQLTSLDLSNNPLLEDLYCSNNELTSLDVSKNTELDWVDCSGNELTSLDVSKNTALRWLKCHDNQLTSLDVSKNTALEVLLCSGNQLTSLDVSHITKLSNLQCSNNELTSLDVSKNTALGNLYCYNNQLTSLDVSKNTRLMDLRCYDNELTSLDVSQNTALERLLCSGNKLTSLDVSQNKDLFDLGCYDNQLTSLDVSGNTALLELECYNNLLTSLEIGENTALEELRCYNNQLTSLDVSKNTALECLWCSSNQLTDLDVSKNTKLEVLYCYNNQLTDLNVSKNTMLSQLYCYNNQLTSLDLSNNTSVSVRCYNNRRTVTINENDQFDLSTLPGFDVTKASNWEGGTVSGTVLTVNSGCESVTYTYQMGNGWSETFTLKIETEAADPDIIRLAGSNRFETATLVADQMKETLGIEQFDAVILANGYNFADALAGSYLSTVKDAPILLTWNGAEQFNYLNDATIQYVKDNLKPGGTVYILGGTAAVPASIDAALADFNIARMDGANRFETNIMILEEAGVEAGSEILVCTSTNFADSLSASAAGKPILLVYNEGGKLFDNQKTYLEDLENCTFTVVGGESAVSAGMLEIFSGYGETTRLAGSNRFETSVLVAEKYFPDATSAVLAYAWDFPDGLCGGGLANAMGAPLILTMTNYESQAVDYIRSKGIAGGIVLGGEKLISEGSVHLIFGLIAED